MAKNTTRTTPRGLYVDDVITRFVQLMDEVGGRDCRAALAITGLDPSLRGAQRGSNPAAAVASGGVLLVHGLLWFLMK